MSFRKETVYDSGCLKIEKNEAGDFFLRTKWRFFAFVFAMLICGVLACGFGAIAFLAVQEFWEIGFKDWKGELFGLLFGGSGLALALGVLRAAFWDCLPKTLRVSQSKKTCFARTYMFLHWTIPMAELQAVGLEIGAGKFIFSGCLHIFKTRGINHFRLCTTSQHGSYHQAYKDGMEVAEIISSALNVPIIHRTKKKGWQKTGQ